MSQQSQENLPIKKSHGRLLHFDILRILCIFFVIVVHVSSTQWRRYSPTSYEWQVMNIYDSTCRICIPILFMISGVFLLNPDRPYTLKKLFTHNLLRLITAFIFWSLFYIIVMHYWLFPNENTQDSWWLIKQFVAGRFHLWFLYALGGLYLAVPILRKICEEKFLMEYFLVVSFVLVCGGEVLSLYDKGSQLMYIFKARSELQFFMGYTMFFIAGQYFYRYPVKGKKSWILYILGILGVVSTVLLTQRASIEAGKSVTDYYSRYLPNSYVAGVALFVFFSNVVSKIRFSKRQGKFILFLSNLSFGIYLIHEFSIRFVMRYLDLNTTMFNPVLAIPMISAIAFLFSLEVIFILSRIPVANKYLM